MSMRYVRGGNGAENQDGVHREGDGRGRGGRSSRGRGGRGGGRRGGIIGGRFPGRGSGRVSYSFVRGQQPRRPDTGSNNASSIQNRSSSFAVGSKTWVRTKREGAKGPVGEMEPTSTPTENAEEMLSMNNGIEDKLANSSLERRGNHKLVMKKDADDFTSTLTEKLGTEGSNGSIIVEGNEGMGEVRAEKNAPSAGIKPVFQGENRWKRRPSKEEPSVKDPHEYPVAQNNNHTALTTHSKMERRGFGKLVLKSSDSNKAPAAAENKVPLSGGNKWSRETKGSSVQNSRQNVIYAESHNKRKRENHSPGARRINLSKPSMPKDDTDPPAGEESEALRNRSNDEEKGVSPDPEPSYPEKTLTDFCYKDVGQSRRGAGRGRGRGRGGGRSGRDASGGNMGLVRVKPQNPSSTPICPTFRRGLPCNNPKCILRHDVPSEASRPICVFFQRNGMCSKGDDCPFQHVKIPWDADICPMFAKVGYCENEDCTLRHVIAKKPRGPGPSEKT